METKTASGIIGIVVLASGALVFDSNLDKNALEATANTALSEKQEVVEYIAQSRYCPFLTGTSTAQEVRDCIDMTAEKWRVLLGEDRKIIVDLSTVPPEKAEDVFIIMGDSFDRSGTLNFVKEILQ